MAFKKVIPAADAIALIRDGDVLATTGYGGNGTPEKLFVALEERFVETGAPRDLTLVYAGGPGDGRDKGLHHLVARVSQIAPLRRSCEASGQERVAPWCVCTTSGARRRPEASQDRPKGRFSRPLGGRGGAPRIWNREDAPRWPHGASGTLDDDPASPTRPLLPRKREKRS